MKNVIVKNLLLLLTITVFNFMSTLASARIISPVGAIVNDNIDDSDALQSALDSLLPGDTLALEAGTYNLSKTLIPKESKQRITILGKGTSTLGKTTLKKTSSLTKPFVGQYLLAFTSYSALGFKQSEIITIKGIKFQGLTDKGTQLVNGEEGVFFASTKNILIENNIFQDFGDSALRITTSKDEKRPGVQSSSARVRFNTFERVTQVTTTQASTGTYLPGTANILFEGNTFIDSRAGIKLATRAPVSYATIKGNTFNGGCTLTDSKGASIGKAIEIVSYSKVAVEGNLINGCNGTSISAYPNNSVPGIPFIPWGEICIAGNEIKNTNYGIRVEPFRPSDPPSEFLSLIISSNQFNTIRYEPPLPFKGIIWNINKHLSSSFRGLRIEHNRFSAIPIKAKLVASFEGNSEVDIPRGVNNVIQDNLLVSATKRLQIYNSQRKRSIKTSICPVY